MTQGNHEIEINGEKIQLRFCTWSLKRFCEAQGNISFQQMLDLFSGGLSISHITSLLLSAAEYHFIKDKKPFPFTDIDACEWIDELGGVNGAAFVKVIEMAGRSLMDAGATDKKKAKVKR